MDLRLFKKLTENLRFTDVFIAFLGVNKQTLNEMRDHFSKLGAYCWVGETLPGGNDSLETYSALRDADFVFVLSSKDFINAEGWHQAALVDALDIAKERGNRMAYIICLSSDGNYPESLRHLQPMSINSTLDIAKLRKAILSEFNRRQEQNSWPTRQGNPEFYKRWNYPEA